MNIKSDKRNYGIDALRLYAMFLVVVLHVLGQGGVISLASKDPAKYAVVWFYNLGLTVIGHFCEYSGVNSITCPAFGNHHSA